MKITWLGTASILLETEYGKLLFDPYLQKINRSFLEFPFDKIRGADAVLITHPHFDHFSDIPEVLEHVSCDVYTNDRGLALALRNKFDLSRIKCIRKGDELTFGDIRVKALPGRHSKNDKALVIRTLKRTLKGHIRQGLKVWAIHRRFKIDLDSDVLIYHIKAEGKSILLLGTASLDAATEYPEADVLIYPYAGRSDILPYSLNIIERIRPETVITDHFDDAFPPITAPVETSGFKEALKKSGINLIVPTVNTPIAI